VILNLPDVPLTGGASTPSEVEHDEARAGRARAFGEETRDLRMQIDREAQRRFERKVSWGVTVGGREELWTNVAAPVMTRLRQPQRQVLDTLVASGVPSPAPRHWPGAFGWLASMKRTGSPNFAPR
jgi:hypothetical protein